MNRENLKNYLITNLFSVSGKFRSNQLQNLPVEIVDLIFLETSTCQIDNIRDRIYWIINDIVEHKKCLKCNNIIIRPIKNFKSSNPDYCNVKCRMSDPNIHASNRQKLFEKTGYEYPLQNPATIQKTKRTNVEKYGCENVFQNEDIKKLIKHNSFEKYGIEVPSNSVSSKEKRKQTVLDRYGVENVAKVKEFQRKIKDTNVKKYGVENVNQVEEFRQKARDTNIKKYGIEYPGHHEKGSITCFRLYGVKNVMHDFEIFQRCMKSRFKIKRYVADNGVELFYQGYEDVAIKFLIDKYLLPAEKIATNRSSVPSIFYDNPVTLKKSRYYPDIWVEDLNLLIEVKSEYTFKIHPSITLEKQNECKRQGFNHIILICSKTKILEML